MTVITCILNIQITVRDVYLTLHIFQKVAFVLNVYFMLPNVIQNPQDTDIRCRKAVLTSCNLLNFRQFYIV